MFYSNKQANEIKTIEAKVRLRLRRKQLAITSEKEKEASIKAGQNARKTMEFKDFL